MPGVLSLTLTGMRRHSTCWTVRRTRPRPRAGDCTGRMGARAARRLPFHGRSVRRAGARRRSGAEGAGSSGDATSACRARQRPDFASRPRHCEPGHSQGALQSTAARHGPGAAAAGSTSTGEIALGHRALQDCARSRAARFACVQQHGRHWLRAFFGWTLCRSGRWQERALIEHPSAIWVHRTLSGLCAWRCRNRCPPKPCRVGEQYRTSLSRASSDTCRLCLIASATVFWTHWALQVCHVSDGVYRHRRCTMPAHGDIQRMCSDQQAGARGKQQKIYGQREVPVGQTPEDRKTEPGAEQGHGNKLEWNEARPGALRYGGAHDLDQQKRQDLHDQDEGFVKFRAGAAFCPSLACRTRSLPRRRESRPVHGIPPKPSTSFIRLPPGPDRDGSFQQHRRVRSKRANRLSETRVTKVQQQPDAEWRPNLPPILRNVRSSRHSTSPTTRQR